MGWYAFNLHYKGKATFLNFFCFLLLSFLGDASVFNFNAPHIRLIVGQFNFINILWDVFVIRIGEIQVTVLVLRLLNS